MIAKIGKEIFILLIIFAGFTAALAWFFNGGVFSKEIRYYLYLSSPFSPEELKEGKILEVTPASEPAPEEDIPVSYSISISKIKTFAPIIIPADDTMPGILSAMEDGVALFPGSTLPGKNGRAIILGHSSRASWYRGNYAYVFSLLSKLQSGDEFEIQAGNKTLKYRVFETHTLSPNETNILLSRPVDGSEADLITCYPVGAASQRTIIRARLLE